MANAFDSDIFFFVWTRSLDYREPLVEQTYRSKEIDLKQIPHSLIHSTQKFRPKNPLGQLLWEFPRFPPVPPLALFNSRPQNLYAYGLEPRSLSKEAGGRAEKDE